MSQTSLVADRDPTDADALVHLHRMCVVYGRGEAATIAVEDLNLDIGRKEFICVIGPSGCGKSTVLKALAGLLPPGTAQGTIRIDGRTPEDARRANSFAYVFQEAVLAPWRTALQNVNLPLEVARGGDPADRRDPAELLELVGLSGFEDAYPDQLSGGMRQRVAIARALTLHPSVLLMDEPFGALDEITRDRMHAELLRIWDQTDTSVVLVTHSLTEAVFMADRVVVMSPRPGRLSAVLDIDFPRPRTNDLKASLPFHEKVNELRLALEDA